MKVLVIGATGMPTRDLGPCLQERGYEQLPGLDVSETLPKRPVREEGT